MTGLSSPKRYLWDVEPVTQNWRVRSSSGTDLRPLIERSIYKHVNSRGDVLDQVRADQKTFGLKVLPIDLESADSIRFSRSSFFTFMVLEIICQAMAMINNPGVRRRDREKDSPRRLRRIIMTIPSATPVQEQRIIRSRTEAALKLFWLLMGWTSATPGVPRLPAVHTSWTRRARSISSFSTARSRRSSAGRSWRSSTITASHVPGPGRSIGRRQSPSPACASPASTSAAARPTSW
jgi:hypothetical protein